MPIDLSKYYSETPEEPTAFDLTSYYEPEEAPSFLDELSGALSAGYRNMKAGVAGTGYIVGAAERGEVAASFMDAIKNQPETPEYYTRFIDKAMKEGKDITEAEGFWDTTIETLDLVGELMKEAITNPKGLAYGVVESGAQALPAIGLTIAGGIAGIPAGPLGIAGGMASGSALGTFAVEAGGHLKGLIVDKLRKEGKYLKEVTEQDIIAVMESEEFMDWAETESTKRGLAVGAVEGIFAAFGGKILAGAAGKSVFSKVGRGIADVGIQTVGEAGGELAGQIVTEGPISPGEVGLEAIMGLGQSVATTATGAVARKIAGIIPAAAAPTAIPGEADIAPGAVPEEFRGDALDQELEATTRQGEALTGERDALDVAIVAEESAVAGEPETFQQEVTDAMALINSYPAFEAVVAGMKQQGALAPSIVKDLYDQALSIPHPQRTEGQKALVEMGRAAEAKTASPIENLRAQPEDVVTEPLPEISEEDKATVVEAIPEELKGIADREPTVEAPAAPVTEVAEAPAAPVEVKTEIDREAQKAQTSEISDLPEPSDAQIEAGNYKKGHIKVQGLDISVENPKGSTRSGTDPGGKAWSITMKDHYGYIKRTEGADGEQIDVFVGDDPTSEKVFIVDQIEPSTGKFDEHKVILGAKNVRQAKMFYNRNYARGWKGAGAVTEMSMDEFKTWVKSGDTKAPVAELKKPVAKKLAPKKVPKAKKPAPKKVPKAKKPVAKKPPTTILDIEEIDTDKIDLVGKVVIALAGRTAVGGLTGGNLVANQARTVAGNIQTAMYGGTPYKDALAIEHKRDSLGAEVFEDALAQVAKKIKKPVAKKPAPKKAETKVKHEVEKAPEVTTKKPVPIGQKTEPAPTPVSRPSTAETYLRKGSIHDAIGYIRDNTDNPVYAEIIKKILPHISDDVTVEVLAVGSMVPADLRTQLERSLAVTVRDLKTEKIIMYMKDETFSGHGMREETIIHEAIHAATMEVIEVGNRLGNAGTEAFKSVQELYKLQNKVMKYLNDRISVGTATKFEKNELTGIVLGNVHEIVAWGLTNAEFQAYLKSIPFDKRNTLWSKFTKTIAKLLGFNSTEHNAFVELLEATNSILDSDFRQEVSLRKKMMSTSKTTPSFKHAKATMKKNFALAQLKTEQANLDYERANRLDIKAGKKFKEIDAKVKILSQEIQDERAQDPYFDEGEGDVFDTVNRITAKPEQMQTIHERISQWVADHAFGWSDVRRFFGTKITDIYAIEQMEIEAYGKRLTAERSPTALSLEAKNAQVAASIATTKFGLKLVDNQLVIDHDQPGLEKILEPVAKLGNKYLRLWETWAVVKRAERLATEGREKFILDTEIQQIKDYVDARPNLKTLFEGTHAQYQKFNRSVLQLAIDAGWINEQDAFGGYRLVKGEGKDAKYIYQPNGTMFESAADAATDAPEDYLVETVDGWYHDDYVPFNRLNEVDKRVKGMGAAGKIGQVRKGVVGLKGGLGKIPVLENMVKNVSFIISGTMRTIAMQATVKMALGVAVEKIEDAGIAPMVDPKTARAALASVEIPTEGMTDVELQRWQRMLSAVHPAAKDTVVVYTDGRPKHYRVLDPHLLQALKNIGPYQAKTWLKIIGFPTRLLSASITKMPAFLVKNLVREIQNAYIINEKNGLNPLKTLSTAIKNFGKLLKVDNPEMLAMMAGGAVNFNSYYNAAPDDVRKRLSAMGVNKSALRKVVESPWTATKNLWQLYMRVAVASEYANRLSVRKDYLDAGASEAEANYQALDVLNFSRRGDGLVMEILLATIPFLNPRIQGADRLYRGTKQNWKAMAMKTGLMAASAVALSVWNWENNEEEMDKLKEEDKDLWYHFWIGGEHWRIPKGFEIGQIAGTLPERIIEQIRTDNPEPVWSSYKRFMMMTFGLQYPQIIAPALEIAQNRDFFRQRPIISFGQQFAPTKMQYDVWTSKVMIDLAQSMPDGAPEWARSPKKLEHLFKAYTASMGALVLEGANDLYRMTGNAPDAPTKALAQRYFIRDFYRSGVERSSRQINRFYSMTEEVGKIAVGLKAARENSMSEWRAMKIDNKEKIRIRSRLNKLSNKMRKQNIKIRKIMDSTTMDGDTKFIKIQEIQKRKNAIAVEATDKYWHIFEG